MHIWKLPFIKLPRRSHLFLLAVVLLFVGCARSIPSRPDNLGLDQISFTPQKPAEWRLANGLTVLFIEDHELPTISGTLYLRGGSLFEGGDIGLAASTGSQMREGGTVTLSPEALDRTLDRLAASVETSFGDEFGSAGFFCLSEDFAQVFSLFAEVVRHPRFDENRLSLWKQLATESIVRRRDNPDTMLKLAFDELIYGGDSPYGRSVSLEDIQRISKTKLEAFHRRFVIPQGAILTLAGDLSQESAKELVERAFGSWKGDDSRPLELPAVTQNPAPGIYVLRREFPQAGVMMGHLGPERLTADMYDIALFNYLFGYGGFGSELFQEVRTRQGLAYDVWGGINPGPVKGTVALYAGTRVEQVIPAIKAMLSVTEKTAADEPSKQAQADAQSAATRSFVFKFDDSLATVNREALRRLLSYPDDYDERFVERINAVSPEAVRLVAERRVDPKKFVMTIVGNVDPKEIASAFGQQYPVYELSFDTKPHIIGRVSQ